MEAKIYIALLLAAILGAVGQVLLKLGASGREEFISFLNPWVFSGLIVYGLGTILWIYALSRASLTLIYPFTALTFVLVCTLGVFVLGETITAKTSGGILLVLAGLLLISVP